MHEPSWYNFALSIYFCIFFYFRLILNKTFCLILSYCSILQTSHSEAWSLVGIKRGKQVYPGCRRIQSHGGVHVVINLKLLRWHEQTIASVLQSWKEGTWTFYSSLSIFLHPAFLSPSLSRLLGCSCDEQSRLSKLWMVILWSSNNRMLWILCAFNALYSFHLSFMANLIHYYYKLLFGTAWKKWKWNLVPRHCKNKTVGVYISTVLLWGGKTVPFENISVVHIGKHVLMPTFTKVGNVVLITNSHLDVSQEDQLRHFPTVQVLKMLNIETNTRWKT